jgi:chaperonin cofactor prefoldin
MNDPLKIEQRGEGLRNALYSLAVAVVLEGVGGVWYMGQIEGRFENRMENSEHQATQVQEVLGKLNDSRESAERRIDRLENDQSQSDSLVKKLDDAREDTRVHFNTVDNHVNDVDKKVDRILQIVTDDDSPAPAPPPIGGIPNGGPENFQRPLPRGR